MAADPTSSAAPCSAPRPTGRTGQGAIVARRVGAISTLARAEARSPLRLLHPVFPDCRAAAVCLVTFGGGLVDGDRIDLDLVVEPGATLLVFTQSTTKVFRGSAAQRLRAEVHGTLVLLPDPVACFGGARYEQRVDVDLRAGGACVLLDGFTSGRAAHGERWAFDRLDLRTTITEDGRAVLRDALVLDGADAAVPPRLGAFEAMLTAVAFGARAAPIARALLEPRTPSAELVVTASPLPVGAAGASAARGAIARFAATSPARALAAVRRSLRNLPEIEAVDPFASKY